MTTEDVSQLIYNLHPAFGPMDGMTYGNNLNRTNSYDLDYRLTGLTTPAVLERNYTYDMANNITAVNNPVDTNRSQSFDYDVLNRLTDATGIYGDYDYTYDANGNRLTSVIDTHPETYAYDTASHHLLQTVNGGTRTYSYDANGNTTSNTDRDFIYGDNNRLKVTQISGVPVATNTYNGRGERVKKQGTDTTLYYYDQTGQLIAELDALGNTLREYIYLDGQPLAYVTNGNVNFIHIDQLGTPQVITDASQQVVWQADYAPFGEATITTQTITNNLRFPGQYYDQETSLHYNYFRDYDPSIGRYIQSDSIGLTGGMNTYSYSINNPIVYFDDNGQMSRSFFFGKGTDAGEAIGEGIEGGQDGIECRNHFCKKKIEFIIFDIHALPFCIDIGSKDIIGCATGCIRRSTLPDYKAECLNQASCRVENPPGA